MGYKNNQACALLFDHIGLAQKQALAAQLSKAKYFSIQTDGSTDSVNVEDELYLVIYFDPFTNDGEVHIRKNFLSARPLAHCSAEGLYECFVFALDYSI